MADETALQFLTELEKYLRDHMEPRDEVTRRCGLDWGSRDKQRNGKTQRELVFLDNFILPRLYAYLLGKVCEESKAKNALLSESWKRFSAIASATPARHERHPFKKAIGASAQQIWHQWKSGKLVQSCPDLALRDPYKIVIEGKYFHDGGPETARRALVHDLYECFFYRGLSKVKDQRKGHADWDYDYACLITYDATAGGSYKKAWTDLPDEVRRGFWEGANLYIIILGGKEGSK